MKRALDSSHWPLLDGAVALSLAALSLAAHWSLRTQMLYAWDSVLYVLALDNFDIGQHRPQPPGYLLYVLTARLVRDLGGLSPNDAYVSVSQLAGAATIGVLYLTGRDLFNRPVGLVAALLAATSFAFSIYSAVTYPYTVLALGSTLLGWLCWWVGRGRAPAWTAGLALGVLGGFRQDLLLFLGPLVLVSVGVRSPRRLLGALLAGGVGVLVWLVPSALLSGGLAAYLTALVAQSQRIQRDTSVSANGLASLIANVRSVVRYSLDALSLAVVPALLYVGSMVATPAGRRDRRAWHLALWAGPALLFYSVIHIGDIGYVFSFMPAAWLATGAGLELAARWLAARLMPAGTRYAPGVMLALLTALPVAFSLWWLLFSAQPLSAAWLRCRDRQWAEVVAHVRATYPPATTILLTSGQYQQVRYELPEYQVWFQDSLAEPVFQRTVPSGVTNVIVVDWLLNPAPYPRRRDLRLSCGDTLPIYEVDPGDVVIVQPPLVEVAR